MPKILFFGNLPQTRFATTFRFALSLLLWLVFVACFLTPAKAAGPLSVGSSNPRFFVDSNGKAVYLTGVHLNNDLIDRSDKAVLDFTSYLNFLQQYEHNFVRLWAWEQAAWVNESTAKITFDPLPYQRKGPGTALDGGRKFDLSRFNQTYFDRLRSRVVEAGQNGIYVSVMLFQGFSSQRKNISGGNPWTGHPFNVNNNINDINGDPSGNDNGEEVHSLVVPAITSLQEAYVRKVVDTLSDLDNVLYEISGDAPVSSRDWQYYMINYLKSYEATKPKQHPVGMSYLYLGTANDLLASPADWILLPGADTDPLLASGSKVIFSDMDPKLLGGTTSYPIVWKSFMRGLNPIYLESDLANPSADENVRSSMGYTLKYSQLVNLSSMSASSELCSSGYCLINPGREYLVYLPTGGTVRVDLSAASGSFVATWFSPLTGRTTSGGTVSGGIPILFTSPVSGDAVLYLQAMPAVSSQNSLSSTNLLSSGTVLTAAATSTQTSSSSLSNTGPVSVAQGASVTTTISAALTASRVRSVSFSVSGLPQGVSAAFSPSSCTPNCSTQLKLTASSSAAVGNYTITVTGKNKQYQATTNLAVSVTQPPMAAVSPPIINPNGGTFTNSMSVSLQTSTSGASIYYTTDGTTPTQSSKLYSAPFALTATALVKAEAFKSGMTASSQVSAWFTQDVPFDFVLSNSGNKSVTAGSSITNTISTTLASGTAQAVSFSTAGLPSGATASFSSNSCSPTCSSTLTINTSSSTAIGSSTITVTAAGGGLTKATTFSLTVSSPPVTPTVATPTISPNGGSFSGSVSVTLQTATSGASIYYTTDGSTPTQSSTLYKGAMTLTNSATVKAIAFMSGSNPSAQASASFTVTSSGTASLTNECSNPQAVWIWCDDFETNRLGSYFEYDNSGGDFVPMSGVGVTGSLGMRTIYRPGQSNAGNLKLAFGSTPSSYFKSVDAGTAKYREVYWRMYVKNQSGWTGGGGDKLSRAIVFANSNWAEAAVGHVWSGSSGSAQNYLFLDPASGTDTAGNLQTTTYNDNANMRWLGAQQGTTPLFDSSHVGQWHCVETHMKLNTAGQSDGVFELWVDGNLDAQGTGLNWLGSYSAYGINAIFFENYWNATSPVVQERYIDNIVVSTQPIGCGSSTASLPFDFSLSNTGNKSVTAASSVTNTISAALTSGSAQAVSFSASGLPTGATPSFSSASCGPTCSSTLTINTTSSTPAGTFLITVTGAGGGVTKTTTFSLTVSSPTITPTVATPTISPNGGSFSGSVSVTLQTATTGASIYYTTDGSTPTQSSKLYTGAMTLTSNTTVKAVAFQSGSNPSAVASASFTVVKPPPQLTATWQDNSTNESNFGVERKTGTSGTYARIALVAANITSYVDTSVTSGVTYCYRVDAINSAGASAYTNEACATAP